MIKSNIVIQGDAKIDGDLVGRDKHSTIINNYYEGGGTASNRNFELSIDRYLRWVIDQNATIVLRGIDRKNEPGVEKLSIDQVYVPLDGRVAYLGRNEPLKKRVRDLGKSRNQDTEMPSQDEVSLADALKLGKRLIIVGGAGSGKSTLLMHMAWAVGSSLFDKTNRVAYDKLGLSDPLPIPVIFPVAKYSERRKKDGAPIQDFISDWLRHKDAGVNLPPDFFTSLLSSDQPILVLFDGLDEIPDEDDRALVRHQIESFLSGKPNIRTVVTCRTVAYKDRSTFANDFCRADVKPLDFERHITPMVERVYKHIFGRDESEANTYTQRLLTGIQKLEADRKMRLGKNAELLVDSPLMTRLLIIVNYSERQMPQQRAELFDKAVDALLRVDYGSDEDENQRLAGDWQTRRELAQFLAFEMHKNGDRQGREIDHAQLQSILKQRDDISENEKQKFVAHARGRGGLLEERDNTYRFLHLALQEFLVARYLHEVKAANEGLPAVMKFFKDQKLNDSWWRECILLFAGYKNSHNFIKKLLEVSSDPTTRLAAAELAGVSAVEARSVTEELKKEVAVVIKNMFADKKVMSQPPATLRAAAGRALARLGDPRDEVMTIDAMPFCFVPAGAFDMGSDETDEQAYDDEKYLRKNVPVPAFWISQHPISNAQYAQFVKAGGYRLPHDYGEPYTLPNHPVIGVTWSEALAFTRWLNEIQNLESRGFITSLPTETEWEKAARGGHVLIKAPKVASIGEISPQTSFDVEMTNESAPNRRVYPWGNDKPDGARANFDGAGINSTSALGCFPLGASPYGCQDMSGNVWEWCFTKWQDSYKNYRDDDDFNSAVTPNDIRVLRGGSDFNVKRNVRCADRYRSRGDYHNGGFGFRVVLRSHLPLSSEPSAL